MMKRWFGLLGLAVLLGLPAPAWGQDEMTFDDSGGGDEMTFDDSGGGGETGGDLAGLLGTTPTTAETEEPIQEEVIDTSALPEPEIWAVQQAYVLRDGRFELTPTYGISLNDPFVTHNAFGIKLGWYITEVLGIAASFQWYQGLDAESEDNFHIPRSFRLVVPINEYQLGANLHFSYVPIYGKLSIFNEWIFHWDCFIEGGVGFLYTRPIPVVDPEVRTFDFGIRVAANIGIGARIFITKFVAIYIQYLDFMYMEKIENLQSSFPSETVDQNSPDWPQSRFNPDNWLGESKFTNDMMLFVGASIFFPFTFEYEYPK